jgi:type IV pilus biogenesis protein CpaD/CtpE
MPRSNDIRLILTVATALALSSCATAPVLHTEAQLNDVGTRCGFALGELMQDEIEKRLLLIIRNAPSAEQRVCVARWARTNHLKAVFVQVQFPEEPAT